MCAKRGPLLSSSTGVLLGPSEGLLLHQMPQKHLDPLGGDCWTAAASHGPESGFQRPRGPCLWLGSCWWMEGNKELLVSPRCVRHFAPESFPLCCSVSFFLRIPSRLVSPSLEPRYCKDREHRFREERWRLRGFAHLDFRYQSLYPARINNSVVSQSVSQSLCLSVFKRTYFYF